MGYREHSITRRISSCWLTALPVRQTSQMHGTAAFASSHTLPSRTKKAPELKTFTLKLSTPTICTPGGTRPYKYSSTFVVDVLRLCDHSYLGEKNRQYVTTLSLIQGYYAGSLPNISSTFLNDMKKYEYVRKKNCLWKTSFALPS